MDNGQLEHRAVALSGQVTRLRRVSGRLWEEVEGALGLSEVHAMALEAVADDARQVSEVAEACGRHVSSTSRIVDALVRRGLLERREDPSDRRAVRLRLTDRGEAAVDRVRSIHATLLAGSLARLEPAEADDLIRLVTRLADALEETIPELRAEGLAPLG